MPPPSCGSQEYPHKREPQSPTSLPALPQSPRLPHGALRFLLPRAQKQRGLPLLSGQQFSLLSLFSKKAADILLCHCMAAAAFSYIDVFRILIGKTKNPFIRQIIPDNNIRFSRQRFPFSVKSSGSPGPAPIKYTFPFFIRFSSSIIS